MKTSTIILSRTDAIGDVVLTLPMAGVLRALFPDCRILFLGRSYTEAVVAACIHIDSFLNWDEWKALPPAEAAHAMAATGADTIVHVFPDKRIASLAKQAGLAQRIGTTNRLYHWFTCNRLVRLSRKNSGLHEAQLNLKLLVPLGAKSHLELDEIGRLYGLTRLSPLPEAIAALHDPDRFNLILHPKSRGSAREWGLENFAALIRLLPRDRFKIFISGTAAEGALMPSLRSEFPFVTDLTGRLSLGELMSFIARADGLVAASTGPLHLASALGIHALGIYPPIRPMHPGRWGPVGPRAMVFVRPDDCSACRKTADCSCMRGIAPQLLSAKLLSFPKH